MRYRLVVMVALVAAFALATWAGGWWTVPIVAFVAGTRERSGGARPLAIAIAAAVAWGVLLIGSSTSAAFATLMRELAGIMALPRVAILLLALVFPALLAWSAAALAGELFGRERGTALGAGGVPLAVPEARDVESPGKQVAAKV